MASLSVRCGAAASRVDLRADTRAYQPEQRTPPLEVARDTEGQWAMGAGPSRTTRLGGCVWVSEPLRTWRRGLHRSRKWRRPRNLCPPAAMLPLCLCQLCPRRLRPRSPPTRLFAEAARQRSDPRNYYELLGVHPGASTEEVKRAFFSKSKELHPDRDPGNPTLHSRFVELSEAYQILSREQSRREYDYQLRSATPPKSPGTTAHAKSAHQAHSSWTPPNAQYWAQFHRVRPQGPESRQQQRRHNKRVLGYCLLVMLAGMGLHYVAFRKLEQMHRNFMDEKDRIITAIYNDTRARARANRARLQQEQQQRQQLQPPLGPPPGPGIMPPSTSP